MPVKRVDPVPSDIEIAQAAELLPIMEVAKSVGLTEDDIDLQGKWKAKVHLDVIEKFRDRPNGKYIDVTAITPTPLGEGKTVTTIG
ncbi:MAG: formate--tetrahydrofolate ligase, partial [Chloroflexi bacterium]|nr:formate--tetrahydrofolate ligase [Chloroflexota bacterium]